MLCPRNLQKGLLSHLLLFSFSFFSKGKEINIGWTAWSDAEVVTKMAKKIIESRFNKKVKLSMTDIGLQYQGISKGDLDFMLMSWLPLTHKIYKDKFSNGLVNLGILYTYAKIGWVAPD